MPKAKTPTRGKKVQYTIRGIPMTLDRALRALAKKEKKSLNQLALELLEKATFPAAPVRRRDLNEFIGTWVEDPEFEKAMEDQRQMDEEMWR